MTIHLKIIIKRYLSHVFPNNHFYSVDYAFKSFNFIIFWLTNLQL